MKIASLETGIVLLPIVLSLTTPVLLVGLVKSILYPDLFRTDSQLTALLQPFVVVEMGGAWLVPLIAAAISIQVASMRGKRTTPAVI